MSMTIPERTLGDFLRRARKAAKLSQTGLAAEVGVSQTLISNWENDIAVPSIAEYARLVEATGADWLFEQEILRDICTCLAPDDAAFAAA